MGRRNSPARGSRHLNGSGRPVLESLEPRLLLSANWTVMVYVDGDNNLEGAAIDDVNEMETVGSTAEVNIVVQVDRAAGYDASNGDWEDTRRGLVIQDSNTGIISSDLTSIGEINMGHPGYLTEFIEWAATTYPADHYALILWNHGGGVTGAISDDTNGGWLTLSELDLGISRSPVHLDVIAFDACLMSMLEVAHEVAAYGDVMVASEETIPFDGYPYDTMMADLTANPGWSAAELGGSMVTRYDEHYDPIDVTTLSAVDLAEVPALSAAVDAVADAILTERADLDTADAAHDAAQDFGGYWTLDPITWNLVWMPGDFIDLGGFLSELSANAVNPVVGAAAAGALAQYNTTILSNYSEASLDGTGMTILFPDVGAISELASYDYNEGNFTFVADTSWADFLQVFVHPQPEIRVMDGAVEIDDGQIVPVDFGNVNFGATPVPKILTIYNDGVVNLTLGSVTVPDGFVFWGFSSDTIPAGGSLMFAVSMTTDTSGTWAGDLTIASNDFDEDPFDFAITGQVLASGEVTVKYGVIPITDGETTPIDFGIVAHNAATVEEIFTIRNNGATQLTIGTVTVPGGFTVTQPLETLLGPGVSTTFGVTLDSSVMGEHAGDVSFLNSDGDESPFNFAITGEVTGPDLVVTDAQYTPGPYAAGLDAIALGTCVSNLGDVAMPTYQPIRFEGRLSMDTVWGNDDDVIVYQATHTLPSLGIGEDSPSYFQVLYSTFGGADPGMYYLAVKANSDAQVAETNLDNNVWWSAEADIELYLGDRYTRLVQGSRVAFVDGLGNRVTASFSGPGHADLLSANGRTGRDMGGNIIRIVVAGTTLRSQLRITVGRGTIVGEIIIRDDIGSIMGRGVAVPGNVEITGTARRIVLGDIAGDHTVTIGPPAPGDTRATVDLTFGRLAEVSIVSETPVRSFTATEWLDLDATPDIFETPWIGRLTTRGDRRTGSAGHFQADLLLNGSGNPRSTLGATRIAGDLRQAEWNITGQMDRLTVGGTAADSTIRTTGSMAGVTLGAADGADFLAGMKDTVVRHATDAADFESDATIKSFAIRGLRDGGATRWYFQDSNLSAATIGRVSLLNVNFDNNVTNFGIYARDAGTGREIASVRYYDNVTRARWSYPWLPGQVVNTQDLEILVL